METRWTLWEEWKNLRVANYIILIISKRKSGLSDSPAEYS